MLSRKLTALAALSMVTASSAAAAQSPAPASAPAVRAGDSVQDANRLEGGPALYIIGAILLALILWGIISISDNADSP